MQPVVVQGTAIDTSADSASHDPNFVRGEVQPKQCRDPFFALLGVANFIAVAVIAIIFGRGTIDSLIGDDEAVEKDIEEGTDVKLGGFFVLLGIVGGISVVVSGLMFLIMMAIPTILIKLSLIAVVAITGLAAVVSFIYGQLILGIVNLVFFAIGMCYARAVWNRIPFASANLKTACTSIKQNCGCIILSFLFVILSFALTFVWAIGTMGVFEKSCPDGVCDEGKQNYGLYFVMVFILFFGHQIIQNTLHVCIAGVVGSWWLEPEKNGCCGSSILGGVTRALTTSFGSICFGSLIVAIIQALRALANEARSNGDVNPILGCLVECILSCIEGIVEYFNKWAFIYVGLYGYGYMEAGKNVITLFKNRGWDTIIADDLVSNVFFLLSLVTGLLMGGIGYAIAIGTDVLKDADVPSKEWISFGISLVLGLLLCSIFLSSVSSAVNAVIVLFAEAPSEFESNYPELSTEMRAAWIGAYPDAM